MQDHGFYLMLAYGVGGLLLMLELLVLGQRCRRARKCAQDASQ